jgi:O-antigen/teichoic acid export membrane protein
VAETKSSPAKRAGGILAGLGWNTIGQFLIVAMNLGLTPFLMGHVGLTAYGIFALVSSARGLISNFDAGLGPTGYRYFPVYVGRGNTAITTSLLFTMLTLIGLVVGAEALVFGYFAPDIAHAVAFGSSLKANAPQVGHVLRLLMPALFIAAIRGPMQRLIMAHNRWAFLNATGIIATMAYAATALVVSLKTPGLTSLIWATYAQEAVLFVATAWTVRRYVSLRGLRWLPTSEVRQILRFGGKVQLAALASSFNFEIDALLVGAFFSVAQVGLYSAGVNFSQQVLGLPENALDPLTQEIGRSFGKSGRAGVLGSFGKTQRTWVTALGMFPIAAALQGWFGVATWLGPGHQVAAETAAILVLGSTPLLMNSVVDITIKVVEMPEIESWYLGIGVILNLACTIAAALRFGMLGVPIGTAVGEVASYYVCIYLARRKIGKEIVPFSTSVRYLPALVGVVLAVLPELAFGRKLPTGALGFILNGVLLLPGFIAYYGWVYRDLLLSRFGKGAPAAVPAQSQPGERSTAAGPAHDARTHHAHTRDARNGTYANRQLRGLETLMALGQEPQDRHQYTSRQLQGLHMLMGMAEPDTRVRAMTPPRSASVRLRHTNALAQLYGRSLDPRFIGAREASHE